MLALAVFGIESIVLPVYPGRDMGRYVEAFLQLGYKHPVQAEVINSRGPLAALGVGLPLEIGGWAAEVWLGLLYAASVVAWGAAARAFGARTAVLTSALLLVYPGYSILFHQLASDSLFAAVFAGWALLLTRAILRPSLVGFLSVGGGIGLLVLTRPANQVLVAFALLPFLLRIPWSRRLVCAAACFVGSAVVTQGWYAISRARFGDQVAYTPSSAVVVTAAVLTPLLFSAPWRRRIAGLALVGIVAVVVARGLTVPRPLHYVRSAAHAPSGQVFLFKAYEIDRIVSPANGPASRQLSRVVQRDLLAREPYRSYGITADEFFSSGSDRVFQDLQTLGDRVDLAAVTREALRRHWTTFSRSVAGGTWEMLWSRRVFARTDAAAGGGAAPDTDGHVVVDGKTLPRPSEGQPIPASHFDPRVSTVAGQVHEVWSSPTEHHLVFDDARDRRRFEKLERDTARLSARIPDRGDRAGAVHPLNQLSHVFPPPFVWLVVGLAALLVRRPRHVLAALAPTVAALLVIVGTALVAVALGEYVAPVSPALILLTGIGLLGERRTVVE